VTGAKAEGKSELREESDRIDILRRVLGDHSKTTRRRSQATKSSLLDSDVEEGNSNENEGHGEGVNLWDEKYQGSGKRKAKEGESQNAFGDGGGRDAEVWQPPPSYGKERGM